MSRMYECSEFSPTLRVQFSWRRYDMTPGARARHPMAHEDFLAGVGAPWFGLVRELLRTDARNLFAGCVLARPGAADQQAHLGAPLPRDPPNRQPRVIRALHRRVRAVGRCDGRNRAHRVLARLSRRPQSGARNPASRSSGEGSARRAATADRRVGARRHSLRLPRGAPGLREQKRPRGQTRHVLHLCQVLVVYNVHSWPITQNSFYLKWTSSDFPQVLVLGHAELPREISLSRQPTSCGAGPTSRPKGGLFCWSPQKEKKAEKITIDYDVPSRVAGGGVTWRL